ncbi:MAG: HAD family hydrolase [Bacillota bacterium]|nr:HAD family hydrolase [Bacillota bacterium]
MKKRFEGYLLVSDMDGTLIGSDDRISEKNINAINRFVEAGGIFTIATGRMRESARRFLGYLPVSVPVILYNGTKVYDYCKEEVVYEKFLEEPIKEIIKKLKNHDNSLGIEIYCEEDVHIYNSCRFTDRFSQKGYNVYYQVTEELWNKNWTKILILGEVEQMDKLEAAFEGIFGKVNLIRSGEYFLEIVPQNTSKGHALKELCTSLNIDISKTIAVGDNMNDLELLTTSGYGFCVSNGNEKLLNMVKYQCSSNDDHALESVVNWAEEYLV